MTSYSMINLAKVFIVLAIFMYASPALTPRSRQIHELNVCWNKVTHRLFPYNKWESVKTVLLGLGRLNITRIIMLRKIYLI